VSAPGLPRRCAEWTVRHVVVRGGRFATPARSVGDRRVDHRTDQAVMVIGTPSETSRQSVVEKSAGSMTSWTLTQSMSSWRIAT